VGFVIAYSTGTFTDRVFPGSPGVTGVRFVWFECLSRVSGSPRVFEPGSSMFVFCGTGEFPMFCGDAAQRTGLRGVAT
jgi:hypothetical protein